MSSEAELGEIRAELRNQGADIAAMTSKIDAMTEAVTTMSVQMGHLVTKESCSEGRSTLAEDLKNRMDGSRDITGHNISVGELIKDYVSSKKKGKLTPVPYPSNPSSQEQSSQDKKKERGAAFWIGIASGLLALVIAFYGASTFVDRTIQRQERSDQILQQIQLTLKKQGDNREQPPRHDKAQKSLR